MFRIELLPAGTGDCIWITYGDPEEARHIIVDCGPPRSRDDLSERITKLGPLHARRIELLIVTHIDIDHIGGLVRLLADPPAGLKFGDIWFNGYRHLPRSPGALGVRQAEEVSEALNRGDFPWNAAFKGGPAQVTDPRAPSEHHLPGGMRLTLLSPGAPQLERLAAVWDEELALIKKVTEPPKDRKGVLTGPPLDVAALAAARAREDRAEANGSSIVVLAEYQGKSLLLAGDAPPGVLVPALDYLAYRRGWQDITVDAYKVSHHGSRRSVSPDLLRRLHATHYLISASGRGHQHPSEETVAKFVTSVGRGKSFHFNYRAVSTVKWDDPALKARFSYTTSFPNGADGHIKLDLL